MTSTCMEAWNRQVYSLRGPAPGAPGGLDGLLSKAEGNLTIMLTAAAQITQT